MMFGLPKHEMTVYDPDAKSAFIDIVIVISMTVLFYYLISMGADAFYHTRRLPLLPFLALAAVQCLALLKRRLDLKGGKAQENMSKIKTFYAYRTLIAILLLSEILLVPYLGPLSGPERVWKTLACGGLLAAVMAFSHLNDRRMKALVCP
jgi:hypothetical protein